MARVCCCSRRTCFYIITVFVVLFWATTAVIASYVFFAVALPARRSYYLESDYLRAFQHADFRESIDNILAKHGNGTKPSLPRVLPLIYDVQQLHYVSIDKAQSPIDAAFGGDWTPTFNDLLGLLFDGTAFIDAAGQEYWIYLGGSANEDEAKVDRTVFQHRYKQHTCMDPVYICDMYNEAMNRVSYRWSANERMERAAGMTSEAILRSADCDISPLLCTSAFFGLDSGPVMLVHLKIGFDCEASTGRCPVTWSFVGLPLTRPSWTRQNRIPLSGGGSTVVPAFPSAEEQLWSLMAYAGAEEGLEYGDHSIVITTTLVENSDSEKIQWPEHSIPMGIHMWGWFNNMWFNPFQLDGFVYNQHRVKCHLQYWTDTFLKWWDGEPTIVRPFTPKAAMEERERQKKLGKAMEETQKKLEADRLTWMQNLRSSGRDHEPTQNSDADELT